MSKSTANQASAACKRLKQTKLTRFMPNYTKFSFSTLFDISDADLIDIDIDLPEFPDYTPSTGPDPDLEFLAQLGLDQTYTYDELCQMNELIATVSPETFTESIAGFTEEQKADVKRRRRMYKNRQSARESTLKNKMEIEHLRAENIRLRELVKSLQVES